MPVSADTKPAPYPGDTRAKGWRFELDMEKVRQSDTWALANSATRPWLLMMWATAWEQVPCGSLPNDDELIAARLGMDLKLFAKARSVLLRGWWLADDGRLYHDTIVGLVQEHRKRRQALLDLRHGTGYRRHLATVLAVHGRHCFYCGDQLAQPTLDHVIPRCQGGSDEVANLVPCCRVCNSSKGGRTPEQWRGH